MYGDENEGGDSDRTVIARVTLTVRATATLAVSACSSESRKDDIEGGSGTDESMDMSE